MKCPNCGSENCQFIATTETHGKSFSFSNACCGSILLGPIGILCGACGTGVHSKTHEYWICNTCGKRFNQYEARKSMEADAHRIEKFTFYKEIQARTGAVDELYETKLGERVKEGTTLYLEGVFDKTEIIKTNPVVGDKRIESIKNVIGTVLEERELVHLIFPDERLVIAEKGIIYNNCNYGFTTQIRLYKNYVYLGQCYITMPTETKAEAFYKFVKYISTGIRVEKDERETNYLVLLSQLQGLPEEDNKKMEHFSSQQEYADYVSMVLENSFEKFKKVDPVAYGKYSELETESDEMLDRMVLGYGKWMLCAALVVGIIAWVKEGFGNGIIAAIVEVVVFCFFVGYKCCRLYFKQEKYVPAYLNEAIEESEKNNDDKEGNILVCNYVDVIHKTF